MGKKGPDAPDYTPIANASAQNNETALRQLEIYNQQASRADALSREQFDWAKGAYADDKAQNQQIAAGNIAAQQAQIDAARRAQEHYDRVYQPLEDQLVSQARDYSSPSRRALEMGRASAQVAQTFDTQRDAARQSLEQYGVDPTSTRASALDIGFRANKAAAQAAAANQASQAVDAQGMALMSNAVNVGRGYPGAISTSYGTGVNAGGSAANIGLATTGSGAASMGTGQGWFGAGTGALNGGTGALGAGNQALSGWSSALNNQFNNQNAAAQNSSGFGSILGLAAGFAPMAFGMPPMFASGGAVPSARSSAIPNVPTPSATPSRGGAVPVEASPSRGHVTDDVPARLNAGEFVVPRDTLQWKGEEFFQKLIMKSREERQGGSPAKPQRAAALAR